MKEGQREELCSNEARQPLSAPVTRAEQIAESSGRTETIEGPRVHQWGDQPYKKYMDLNRV